MLSTGRGESRVCADQCLHGAWKPRAAIASSLLVTVWAVSS